MIGFIKENITIGVDNLPNRKKPCLVIVEGNCETKYASFNNEESAKIFMKKFAEFLNLAKINEVMPE